MKCVTILFLKQGLYGPIIDSLCLESLFKKQDFTGFWLPIFLPDPSSVVCSVGSKVINFSISQGNDIRTDRKISFHDICCVFFSRPSISGILSSQMSRFDQDTWSLTESAWWPKVALVLGRVPKVKGRRFQHFQTFHDIVLGWSTTLRHEVKSIHRHEAMIFPLLVYCRLYFFETYNAINTYFNAYTLSFTKTAKQLWIRSLHKGPFWQAIKKSAWATDFSHTNLPGTPNNNFQWMFGYFQPFPM